MVSDEVTRLRGSVSNDHDEFSVDVRAILDRLEAAERYAKTLGQNTLVAIAECDMLRERLAILIEAIRAECSIPEGIRQALLKVTNKEST